MSFDGSKSKAIMRRNFIGMPSSRVTFTMWIKGTKGTAVSYASKNKLQAFNVEFHSFGAEIHVRDVKVKTDVKLVPDQWTHIAVTWDNRAGDVALFRNGELKFHKRGVAKGEEITAGGCLIVGQRQKSFCSGFAHGSSFAGEMSDFQVWTGVLNQHAITAVMQQPVPKEVIEQAGKTEAPDAHKNLRLSWTARQYAKQELDKPTCDLDKYKVKKISGPKGYMKWQGSGDVHYSNFANCKYDDQSVGEWVAVQVDKAHWDAAPLMIQYRTSPQRTNCPWCQNGAVSYIDGCAIKYKDDQASAGFGGFSDPYTPYAAVNGRRMNNFHHWQRTANFRVRADNSRLQAIMNDGTRLYCRRHSIFLRLPRKYIGKVHGLAGSGQGAPNDWQCGPNTDACPECKPGQALPAMKNTCSPHYVYGDRNHPFNGNRVTKPLVRWFQSWQADGNHIPSVFYYESGKHGAGSFNRKNGEKIKPPDGTGQSNAKKEGSS